MFLCFRDSAVNSDARLSWLPAATTAEAIVELNLALLLAIVFVSSLFKNNIIQHQYTIDALEPNPHILIICLKIGI